MAGVSGNYYRSTLDTAVSFPELAGSIAADVCIVGGGLAGLTAALTLLRLGRSVALLDARQIAWGASGRNGGAVRCGYATSFDKIKARVGYRQAVDLYRLSIEGAEIVRRNIDQLHIVSAHSVKGSLRVSRFDDSQATLAYIDWMKQSFDYDVEFMSKDAIRSKLITNKYYCGFYDPNAFHFHPVNYALALAVECERLGAQIFEHTRAVRLEPDSDAWSVRTEHGAVRAQNVLVACGGYTDGLVPQLARSYVPITTYVISTKPAKDLIEKAIRTPCSIGDSRRASDYYRVVEGGNRLLWGGMITTKQAEPVHLGDLLKKRIVDTYPQLRGLEVEQAWSGKMAYARHLMPQIGRLRDGLWYATSFGGHGMNTTAIGGTVVAEGIAGVSDRYRHFEPFGLTWTGGVFGKAAVQLTYWSYRLADFMQERQARRA